MSYSIIDFLFAVMSSLCKPASAIVRLMFQSSLPFLTLSAVEVFHCGSFGMRHVSLAVRKLFTVHFPLQMKEKLGINILFRSRLADRSNSQLGQRTRLNKMHVKEGDKGTIFNFGRFKYALLSTIRCIWHASVFLNWFELHKSFFFFFPHLLGSSFVLFSHKKNSFLRVGFRYYKRCAHALISKLQM